jgi:hypothetical protein
VTYLVAMTVLKCILCHVLYDRSRLDITTSKERATCHY